VLLPFEVGRYQAAGDPVPVEADCSYATAKPIRTGDEKAKVQPAEPTFIGEDCPG